MAQVFLSLGSNQSRQLHIEQCLDALSEAYGELSISRVFESEAVGFDGDSFYNLVVGLNTDIAVGELSKQLKAIEDNNGRVRQGPKFSGRTLDIDILTYDDCSGEVDGVSLPRDEIEYHAFVLLPLAELAPNAMHPTLNACYKDLWQRFEQTPKGRCQVLAPVDFYWRGQRISQAQP